MNSISINRVLRGDFASLWIDDQPVAEAGHIRLEISFVRTDVQIGTDIDSKITGLRGEGRLQLQQVYSRFFELISRARAGQDVRLTITTSLTDPDSAGGQEERYRLEGVALTQLPLVDYTTGQVNRQELRFRFAPGRLRQESGIHPAEVQA